MASKERDARAAWECITRLFIGDETQHRAAEVAASLELTMRTLHALLDLDPLEPKPMRWLAEQWFCDPSNVTGLIDSLQDRGLVVRETSPGDRRVKLVRLTADGVELRERARDLMLRPPAGVLAMSASELRTLRALLEKAAAPYPWPSVADRLG